MDKLNPLVSLCMLELAAEHGSERQVVVQRNQLVFVYVYLWQFNFVGIYDNL